MFTSKGLFSSIPCPFSDSCVLPRCLFLHSGSGSAIKQTATEAEKPETKGSIIKSTEDGHQVGQREKIVNNNLKPMQPTGRGNLTGQSRATKSLDSFNRDVSPPPLRRTEQGGRKASAREIPPIAKTGNKSPAQATLKPSKVEILNPRMLKHSPASHDLRYRLLKALYDQLVKLNKELQKDATLQEEALVMSDQALIKMALDLEESIAVEKPSIYSNVVKNRLLAYKKMSTKEWKEERGEELARIKDIRTGNACNAAAGDPPKRIETGLTEEDELYLLPRLYTPIAGLLKHGYVSSVPTDEEILRAKKGVETAKGWEVCDRCKVRFQVFPGRREEDGALASGGHCTYHWGRTYWQEKSASDPIASKERRYRCCGQLMGDSLGCTNGDTHVYKVSEVKRLAAISNFVETPSNSNPSNKPICIDGEMGYTVHGLELIRLTATSWPGGEELLDILVRPFGEILDLNSRWSGVWPEQIANALTWESIDHNATSATPSDHHEATNPKLRIVSSPAVARTLLFKYLSPQTPLIGHGLENDLNAIRIIHPIIVDTALLFPHKAGLPFRNGLKNLMLTHLQRHIQVINEDKVDGHDSKEDARAAGDLVRWMIRTEWQKMKGNGWVLENGNFTPPVGKGPERNHTVGFLEREGGSRDVKKTGSAAEAPKRGTKRLLAEISRDDIEEGECESS